MTNLIIAALAVWMVLEIWLNSSLLSTIRARIDCWEGRMGELLRCSFCLSPWISFLVVCLLLAADEVLPHDAPRWLAPLMRAPVIALAVARLASLGYLLTPKHIEPGGLLPPTDVPNDDAET